ncbi:Glycine-rich RNA-binding protein 10 [Cardamine amara subsp. amara]|uniref:Glycine-rich RNA-binding protein 10 n=1 Tax=Cardamine amara subsp. amara TaxID=228776 RepID=A0ABD0Z5W1_CARAN
MISSSFSSVVEAFNLKEASNWWSDIINDLETARSRGFCFVTFKDEKSMRDAIEEMNGKDLNAVAVGDV